MKKRIAVIILAAMLATTSLFSCQGNNASSAPPAESAGGASSAGADTGISDPNVAEPGTFPVLKEPGKTKFTIGLSQDSNVLSYEEDNYHTQWIKEKTNADFELIMYPNKGDEARQQIELAVNSDSELPDIILGILNESGWNAYGPAGYLVELSPYFEKQGKFFYDACKDAGLDPEDDVLRYIKSPDGGIYGMPEYGSSLGNSYAVRAWINQDFLKATGMESPTTTDELYEFLKAVKEQDVNGNGRTDDEIGILGNNNGWNTNPVVWLMNAFIYMDNTDDRFIVQDGVLDVAYDKDAFRDGLIYCRKLADEGLLSPNSFTQDNTQYLATINAEDPVVAIAVSGGTGGFNDRVNLYDAVEAIEGPDGAKYATYTPPKAGMKAFITKDCESPEAAFAFLSAGYGDPDYSIIKRFGKEGTDWRWAEDGEHGLYEDLGYKATIKVLNNVWGRESNSIWQGSALPNVDRYSLENGLIVEKDDPANASQLLNSHAVANLMDYTPEEYVVKIIYTQEETEQTVENRAAIRSYVKECMAQFVVGNMDPNNDNDWNAYLSELERLDYKGVLEIDRQAYNRTMGK